MILDKRFLFGGRILANRGLANSDRELTLSNCYASAPPQDNLESIFDCAKKLARTYSSSTYRNNWLADVDGSYGENDSGIFFFTPDGKYIEWTGTYLYSDIPFEVDNPVVTWKEN